MAIISLSHTQLVSIGPSWYWMVSDQVGEFDDFLRRPIRNIELIRTETRRWFDRKSSIDPAGSDTQVSDLMREILSNLIAGGEDAERFYQWGYALDNAMVPTISGYKKHPDGSMHPVANAYQHALYSQHIWIDTLGHWTPDILAFEKRSGPDLRDALYSSYQDEVLLPHKAFKRRLDSDNDAWIKMESRRTEWDNYLWQKWFGEFQYDPASVACDGFLVMKTREWWREIAPTLSRRQRSQLMAWNEQAAHARDTDGFLSDKPISAMDEALMIDDIPPFDSAAARPVEWDVA
ncbi:hypothetical protein [uncultured Tateyamaria sp.]|uniref:hypothetical protein n=1 Tax=uncultured Tateyamaria sp. TaxID=455651 RepID=UPI002637AFF6|nr:hypothetical protein [uncultured Tateyamaria sp.]